MTYCPHVNKRIDGLYAAKGTPIAVAFTCTDCGTSGATMWNLATPEQREEAERIHTMGTREK